MTPKDMALSILDQITPEDIRLLKWYGYFGSRGNGKGKKTVRYMVKELREASRRVVSPQLKESLSQAADKIVLRAGLFHVDLTEENMIELNGAWAHGARLLWSLPPHKPHGGGKAARVA